MFNSPWKLAVAAGIIGAVSNTLRLEMLDITSVPAPVAAFAGAVAAGVLASALKRIGWMIQEFPLRFHRL